MKRDRPYYSKRQIINCIKEEKFIITKSARENALNDFGWDIQEIIEAIKKLKISHWYKTEKRYDDPQIKEDYYRAPNINGENIYTHFHINDEGFLVISSFKRL